MGGPPEQCSVATTLHEYLTATVLMVLYQFILGDRSPTSCPKYFIGLCKQQIFKEENINLSEEQRAHITILFSCCLVVLLEISKNLKKIHNTRHLKLNIKLFNGEFSYN